MTTITLKCPNKQHECPGGAWRLMRIIRVQVSPPEEQPLIDNEGNPNWQPPLIGDKLTLQCSLCGCITEAIANVQPREYSARRFEIIEQNNPGEPIGPCGVVAEEFEQAQRARAAGAPKLAVQEGGKE